VTTRSARRRPDVDRRCTGCRVTSAGAAAARPTYDSRRWPSTAGAADIRRTSPVGPRRRTDTPSRPEAETPRQAMTSYAVAAWRWRRTARRRRWKSPARPHTAARLPWRRYVNTKTTTMTMMWRHRPAAATAAVGLSKLQRQPERHCTQPHSCSM